MKIIFTLLLATTLLASCSRTVIDNQNTRLAEFTREDYSLLDPVTGTDESFNAWILFIRVAGTRDSKMYARAYNRAVKQLPNADGILTPRAQYRKVPVPLILLNFSWKKVEVTGRGYRLKSDAERSTTKAKE